MYVSVEIDTSNLLSYPEPCEDYIPRMGDVSLKQDVLVQWDMWSKSRKYAKQNKDN